MLAQSPEREAHDEVFDNSRSNWNLEMLSVRVRSHGFLSLSKLEFLLALR